MQPEQWAARYDRDDRAFMLAACRELDAAAHGGLLAGLEAMGQAAGLLDGERRLVAVNVAGHALLGRALEVRDERLSGKTWDIHWRFQRLMASAEGGSHGNELLMCEGGATLVVRAARLPRPVGRAATILTFAEAGEASLPTQAALRGRFGLTESEADVALALARGRSLREIAGVRGVAIDTIRSHLRTVFSKTGTRRQASLVVLILGLHAGTCGIVDQGDRRPTARNALFKLKA